MFNWFAFLTYAVITAATPGPNNIMSMSNGGRLGFKGALPFNFGILAGFAAVMLICTAFCSTLTELIPAVKTPMLIAGAAYMLYLAWATYKSDGVITEDHSRSGFYSGLILQFINPKIYIYCIMSMQAYILPFYTGEPFKLTLFALLLAFIGFIFTLCWSAFRHSAFCSAAIPKASTPLWRCFWFTAPHHCSAIKKSLRLRAEG